VTLVEHDVGRSVSVDVPPEAGAAETVEVIETELRAQLKLPKAGC
jgi:hypothetical protein